MHIIFLTCADINIFLIEKGFCLKLIKTPFVYSLSKVSRMHLKDKICIITGAAVGIGRAFAEFLLKEGAFVSFSVKKFIVP